MKRTTVGASGSSGIDHAPRTVQALEINAATIGQKIEVETLGSDETFDDSDDSDIALTNLIALACDMRTDRGGFSDQSIYETTTGEATKKGKNSIDLSPEFSLGGLESAGAYFDEDPGGMRSFLHASSSWKTESSLPGLNPLRPFKPFPIDAARARKTISQKTNP